MLKEIYTVFLRFHTPGKTSLCPTLEVLWATRSLVHAARKMFRSKYVCSIAEQPYWGGVRRSSS